MIKLIATDMDGTFLDNKKQFDKSFIDLFFEMKEQGVLFVAASGNQYARLYQKFLPMSEDMYCSSRRKVCLRKKEGSSD